ncbi:hypothetical protein PCANB_001725 [Pneumocystis canis]|nr:hypothetical protein PCK1_002036 [Pneumocystis canis]KAG5440156.1 hypothetical protein PCANB_001725 [Pneumocystis canis]
MEFIKHFNNYNYYLIFAWVTISIGALLLGLLGIQLIQFQNHQEAYFEMRKDINEASNWLRQHGIDIDN